MSRQQAHLLPLHLRPYCARFSLLCEAWDGPGNCQLMLSCVQQHGCCMTVKQDHGAAARVLSHVPTELQGRRLAELQLRVLGQLLLQISAELMQLRMPEQRLQTLHQQMMSTQAFLTAASVRRMWQLLQLYGPAPERSRSLTCTGNQGVCTAMQLQHQMFCLGIDVKLSHCTCQSHRLLYQLANAKHTIFLSRH